MADRIKARIGDVVETSFNLVFKRAEVSRLPNSAKFEAFDFFMFCEKGGKVKIGAGKSFNDGTQIRCATQDITQDDQAVSAQFSFASPRKDAGFFAVGDVFQLFLTYRSKDATSGSDPKDPDSHLLAEVELVSLDQTARPVK
jgi:hypothetical protein